MSNSPRLYQSAWNQLKSNPSKPLKIAAPNKHHPRIFKALKKEKWMDTVYSLQLAENHQVARMRHTSKSGFLLVTLTLSLGLDEVTLPPQSDSEE